jgi:hypothetical protein
MNAREICNIDLSDGFAILADDIKPHTIRAFRRNGHTVVRQLRVKADVAHVIDHRAVAYAERRAGELIKDFAATTPEMLRGAVVQALEEGWSAGRLRDELREAYAFSPTRALSIARTEMQVALRAGGLEAAKVAGAGRKRWNGDESACELCQENIAAGWIGIDEDFPEGDSPHPNCLVGDSIVTGSGVTAHMRRRYQGELLTIRIAGHNNSLTITPNHSILTQHGWSEARFLRQGDRILYCPPDRQVRVVATVNPNDYNMPSRIDQVPHALLKAGGGSSSCVPTSSKTFNRDGTINSEVDIVRAASVLTFYRQIRRLKWFVEHSLYSCQGLWHGRYSHRPLTKLQECGFSTARCIMGSTRTSRALFWGTKGIPHKLSFGQCTRNETQFKATTADTSAGDTQLFRDLILSFPSQIHLAKLIGIDNHTGITEYVHDLETDTHWYLAQGLVVHNCVCDIDYEAAEEATDTADETEGEPDEDDQEESA